METIDVTFNGDDHTAIHGQAFLPERRGRHPAITMAHGFAATCAHGLDPFARAFVDAGFVVLMHDHRGFGASGGERADIDPWRQIADWRHAISWLESHPAVDPERIGLWGSSFAGGHALVLAATDSRVKAVVSQVPTISGYEQSRRRINPDQMIGFEERLLSDDRRRHAGHTAATQAVVSVDDTVAAVYRSPEAHAFYTQTLPDEVAWDNTVTVRSSRAARMYEPGQWISRVSPTPLLMIVALDDTVTLTDTELAAYERALQPKQLVTVVGGHFGVYGAHLTRASSAARDWFLEHLR